MFFFFAGQCNDVNFRKNNIILSGKDLPAATNHKNCLEIVREVFHQKLNILVLTTDTISAECIDKQRTVKKKSLLKMNSFRAKIDFIEACQI